MDSVLVDLTAVGWWGGGAIYTAFTIIAVLALLNLIAWVIPVSRGSGFATFFTSAVTVVSILAGLIGGIVQTFQYEANRDAEVIQQVEKAGFDRVAYHERVTAEAPDGSYAEGVILYHNRDMWEVIWR